MVQLIKKGGLRERANRSRSYVGSENTEKTLVPNQYREQKRARDHVPEQTSKQTAAPTKEQATDQTDS